MKLLKLISIFIFVLPAISMAAQGKAIYERDGAKIKIACEDCHGINGEGGRGVPSLAGKSISELTQALAHYQTISTLPTLGRSRAMVRMAQGLTPSEILEVARYATDLPESE